MAASGNPRPGPTCQAKFILALAAHSDLVLRQLSYSVRHFSQSLWPVHIRVLPCHYV